MTADVEGLGLVGLDLCQEKGGALVASRPILERGGPEVRISMQEILFEVGDETNDNLVGRV